jgi:mannosylfructose-6-phosphate phosphatase
LSVDDEYLIVSDVDGTLLGDDQALEEFADWLGARREQFRLVYNSGRFPHLVRQSIESSGLPEPDALIGGVGTEIEDFVTGQPLAGWPVLHGRWDAHVVRKVLATEPRLKLQPEKFLSEYKVSYFADKARSEELADWQRKLEAAGQAVRFVYSSQRDLDFLPAGCDKGTAAAFLAAAWDYSPERVIACGDTANDCELFTQGFLGIVVGNALDELKALDAPTIYHATSGFAAGVQEGICYWLADADENRRLSKVGDSFGIDM